jgi:hypothetical protein
VDKTDIGLALAQLEATTKAARLRAVMPLIEAKIAQGVRASALLDALRAGGLELTESTLKSYLYRHRKRQRGGTAHHGSKSAERPRTAAPGPDPEAPPSQAAPVSPQELDRILGPDPASQERMMAHYERIGKNLRRRQQS